MGTADAAGERGGLSPDGRWLAYGINRTNGENELRVTAIADGTTKTIAFGAQPAFSADSRWLAVSVGYSEAQQDKMRKDKKPIRRKLSLVNLSSAEVTTIDGVESFAFSADGQQLLMRHYAPEKARGPPRCRARRPPRSIPRRLPASPSSFATSRRDATRRSATSATPRGRRKAACSRWPSPRRIAPATACRCSIPRPARCACSTPRRRATSASTWRKDADDLVVLRSRQDDKKDGPNYAVLAWTGVGTSAEKRQEYDPAADTTLGAARRLVAFRRPAWSDDGSAVFVGVAPWSEKPAKDKEKDADAGDPPTVDVWHPRDVDVMPKQKVGATRDRQRSLLAAWPLGAPSAVVLGQDYYEQITPLKAKNLAYAVSWTSSRARSELGEVRHVGDLARSTSRPASAPRSSIAPTIASSAPVPTASTSSSTSTASTGRSTRRAGPS